MRIRSRRDTVSFNRSFVLHGVDRSLPPGTYDVVTDDEEIEGLTFLAFRRIATSIIVPITDRRLSKEIFAIDPVDLSEALRLDAAA